MGEVGLKRSLSTVDLLSIGVGAVIGWSWVIYAGPWSTFGGSMGGIIAFILGGIICSFVGLTYAELSSTIPRAGGDISFSFIGLGDKWGYLSGATVGYALLTLIIVETLMFPLILESLGFPLLKFGPLYELGGVTVYVSYILLSILINFLFAVLNFKGIEFSKVFQTITVGVLLMAALFYVVAGVSLGSSENAKPLFTSTTGLVLVMLMVPGFMSGFNIVAQAVEEATIKPKTIGRVVIATVWASTLFYIFIIIGASFSSSFEVREESQLVVIESLLTMFNGNELPKMFVASAALIGMLTSWNAAYIGGSRVIFALGRAKYLPKKFSVLSKKNQTPTYPILLLFVISSLAAFLGTSQAIFTSIVNISGFMMTLSWLLVVIAFKKIRKEYPDLQRPFRVKNGGLVGNVGLFSLIGLMILYTPLNPLGGLTKIEITILAAILLLIVLLYFLYVKKNTIPYEERKRLLLGDELSQIFDRKN
ncbi:APC family amino acid transporter [Sporosarcina newyorkensis 2681]|uniref:APC family amino acid transporter n=1 Tax=Sporosarcina newyorkensis 2681 TaxID=1027292 RepID=F9DQ28_9BACL|nr:APC family permease [Sporosarcina newyorkensis]EGQ27221.1 APC family amino acid transporter [Sporosarcina newyorkensis 2681]